MAVIPQFPNRLGPQFTECTEIPGRGEGGSLPGVSEGRIILSEGFVEETDADFMFFGFDRILDQLFMCKGTIGNLGKFGGYEGGGDVDGGVDGVGEVVVGAGSGFGVEFGFDCVDSGRSVFEFLAVEERFGDLGMWVIDHQHVVLRASRVLDGPEGSKNGGKFGNSLKKENIMFYDFRAVAPKKPFRLANGGKRDHKNLRKTVKIGQKTTKLNSDEKLKFSILRDQGSILQVIRYSEAQKKLQNPPKTVKSTPNLEFAAYSIYSNFYHIYQPSSSEWLTISSNGFNPGSRTVINLKASLKVPNTPQPILQVKIDLRILESLNAAAQTPKPYNIQAFTFKDTEKPLNTSLSRLGFIGNNLNHFSFPEDLFEVLDTKRVSLQYPKGSIKHLIFSQNFGVQISLKNLKNGGFQLEIDRIRCGLGSLISKDSFKCSINPKFPSFAIGSSEAILGYTRLKTPENGLRGVVLVIRVNDYFVSRQKMRAVFLSEIDPKFDAEYELPLNETNRLPYVALIEEKFTFWYILENSVIVYNSRNLGDFAVIDGVALARGWSEGPNKPQKQENWASGDDSEVNFNFTPQAILGNNMAPGVTELVSRDPETGDFRVIRVRVPSFTNLREKGEIEVLANKDLSYLDLGPGAQICPLGSNYLILDQEIGLEEAPKSTMTIVSQEPGRDFRTLRTDLSGYRVVSQLRCKQESGVVLFTGVSRLGNQLLTSIVRGSDLDDPRNIYFKSLSVVIVQDYFILPESGLMLLELPKSSSKPKIQKIEKVEKLKKKSTKNDKNGQRDNKDTPKGTPESSKTHENDEFSEIVNYMIIDLNGPKVFYKGPSFLGEQTFTYKVKATAVSSSTVLESSLTIDLQPFDPDVFVKAKKESRPRQGDYYLKDLVEIDGPLFNINSKSKIIKIQPKLVEIDISNKTVSILPYLAYYKQFSAFNGSLMAAGISQNQELQLMIFYDYYCWVPGGYLRLPLQSVIAVDLNAYSAQNQFFLAVAKQGSNTLYSLGMHFYNSSAGSGGAGGAEKADQSIFYISDGELLDGRGELGVDDVRFRNLGFNADSGEGVGVGLFISRELDSVVVSQIGYECSKELSEEGDGEGRRLSGGFVELRQTFITKLEGGTKNSKFL